MIAVIVVFIVIFFIKIEFCIGIINLTVYKMQSELKINVAGDVSNNVTPLVPYNKAGELAPFGFRNMGSTCYFNAMLQSMLSCTSFVDIIRTNLDNEKYQSHPVTKYLSDLIIAADRLSNEADFEKKRLLANELCNASPKVWKSMVLFIAHIRDKPVREIMQGQQCAREGFHLLMDAIDDFQLIQDLFLHRYQSLIRCFACNQWVSDIDGTYSIFEVQPTLQSEQLDEFKQYDEQAGITGVTDMNSFLSRQASYVDKDFRCPKCTAKGEKYTMQTLTMVPEILVVLSKKYTAGRKLNILTDFPETMVFPSTTGDLTYCAVAQIEHSGGLNGGHYWAICRRAGGWYNINDSRVAPSAFKPTLNTYIVFYHVM
jgi:ubiquitin C-terminal hydrolase